MRKLILCTAAVAAAAIVLGAALQAKPVNAKCPVKGTDVKPGITAEYQGKVIGFC